MKLLRHIPFVIACILLLSSCNAAQSAPPWEAEQATAKPESTADASYSTAIGVSGTSQNGAKVNPTKTTQAVKRIPYKDLYGTYVKHEKTITCDYKGQKLEVLVEILGKEDAVVSCPVVIGLDETNIIKPRDSKTRDSNTYVNALANQFSLDTDMNNYNAEVQKKLDQMTYDNMQLVKKEFGYQYNWQVVGKAGPSSRLIKKLPDKLLASKQYDFQTKVDDETAWALADAIVKKNAEQGGAENSFVPEMRRTLTQWKSRWYESLYIKYYQLFDGLGQLYDSFSNGSISELASESQFYQHISINFDDEGVCQQILRLYKIVRRTAKGDDGLITPECAMDSAMQWLNHGGTQYKNLNMQPTHIVYAYYPMNSTEGVDYKKGEWLMVPCCFVYFNMEDGHVAAICQINALTGKVY